MAEGQALATRAVRGFLWTVSASLLQLVTITVLYKLLPIADMGRFEYALILVMFLALLGDLGLSSALVQERYVDDDHFDAAFWINLFWGIALTALILVGAPLVATVLRIDNAPDFIRALRILGLLIPFASVSGIFRARLQRDLDFSAVALSEVVSVVAFGIIVVPLVLLLPELGVLVPLVGSVVREAGLLLSLCWSARWHPRCRFAWPALRRILPFSLHMTGSRAVAYLNTYIAGLFILPSLGDTAMGYYRLSERLTLTPLTRLATTIFRVSLPTFSTIQDDDGLLRQGYLGSVQNLILGMGPLLVGLYVFAPELLEVLENTPALTVLRLLAVATLLKVIGTMVGSIFMAKGKASWSLYWSLFSLAVLIPAVYLAVPHGVEGIAVVIAGSSLLFLVLSQQLTNRLIGMSARQFAAALARPCLVLLVLFIVLAAARLLLPGSPTAVLIQGTVLGALVLGLALRLLAWELCAASWHSLRGRRISG